MKTIVGINKPIGADGAEINGALVIEGSALKARVEVSFPISKVVDAVVKPLDPLRERLKAAIPGDWDNPIIDDIFDEAKAQAIKLLSE